MILLRIFNNNVVLARDDAGEEVILTGRGLGFQARPGQEVDMTKMVRVFRDTDGRDPDHLATGLADIPPEHVQLVVQAFADSGIDAEMTVSATLLMAVADHVSFALVRQAKNMTIEYPLVGEVKSLYPSEYVLANRLLTAINALLFEPLPAAEGVALAMHFVNAGFSTGDLSWTYTMTGVIQQILKVIEQGFGVDLDSSSVNVARFVTHLRYLFVRIAQHSQLDDKLSPVGKTIRESYPEAVECAEKLAQIVELRMDSALTEDEITYLALHVARVTTVD